MANMACPTCGATSSTVNDSRPSCIGGQSAIRRRRTCSQGHRFTTYEIAELDPNAAGPLCIERMRRQLDEIFSAAGKMKDAYAAWERHR